MDNILGIGNALVDILARLENDLLLEKFSLPKGSMQLVDKEFSKNLLSQIPEKIISPGGSAANTIHGLAKLGVKTGYIGKTGNDELGLFFRSDMEKINVNTFMLHGDNTTGNAITLISRDFERTFATYLGAAIELTAQDLTRSMFRGYEYFYVEGYLVQNHGLIETAMEMAKENNLTIVLDLASYNVVENNLDFLKSLTKKYVDIVFANEEEAEAFTGEKPLNALSELAKIVEIAIVKMGKNGSIIKQGNKVTRISPIPVNAIDTTGAGDLYAAGFLYGLIRNMSLEKCGKIASLLAGNVTEVIGSKMPQEKWEMIFDQIKNIT